VASPPSPPGDKQSKPPEWDGTVPPIIAALGERMSRENLPPPNARWIPRRKAQVLAAVSGGLISFEEACQRYSLTAEELMSWRQAVQKDGLRALRSARLARARRETRRG